MKTPLQSKVTINRKQGLYIIPSSHGFSCLGFQVCIDRIKALALDLGVNARIKAPGTMHNYRVLKKLQEAARIRFETTGKRSSAGLSPQLTGKEGKRVEVVTSYGETRRFIVGKSTGWIPCHLEIPRRDSSGGISAETEYKSVRLV